MAGFWQQHVMYLGYLTNEGTRVNQETGAHQDLLDHQVTLVTKDQKDVQ